MISNTDSTLLIYSTEYILVKVYKELEAVNGFNLFPFRTASRIAATNDVYEIAKRQDMSCYVMRILEHVSSAAASGGKTEL